MKREPIAKIATVNPSANGALRLPTTTPVSFLPMSAVSENGYVLEEQERLLGDVLKGYTAFQRGDVLVAKITPCMENGKAAFLDHLRHEYGFGSTEFHVVRPKPGILGKYLFYMLWNPAFRAQAATCMTGSAGQKRVPSNFVERFTIPIPESPSDQRRIADILDEADALRRKRAEAIQLADDLVPSLFYEIFGDPVHHPKQKWKLKSLSELVRDGTDVTYGIVQCGPHVPDGVPYVRTSDMTADHLDVTRMGRTAPEIASKFARSRVEKGELIISIRASVGTVHLVPPELDGGNLTQGTARIAPGPDTNNIWLLWALRSSGAQRWLTQQCKGTTFREITLGRLRELPLALPPRGLQNDFAALALAASDTFTKARQSETGLDKLFLSLLQRAFRGEL